MAIVYGANYGRPTLDLNFAKNKSLIDTVSGQNLVTFTRGSTGTYVDSDGLIKTASADTPRFDHDPVTGVCNGLLIEESRTNRIANSSLPPTDSLGTSNTIGSNCLTAVNSAIAPDGTLTAYTVNPSSSYAYVGIELNVFSVVSGVTYTASIWVKKIPGITYQNLSFVVNDWATPAIVSFNSQLNASTDWIRVSASFTSNVTATRAIWLIRNQSSSSVASQPLYAWGAQVEVGSFPTSYIPTTGSTVTRSADVASITGTNFSRWYNSSEGTVFFDSALSESVNASPSIIFGNYVWATNPNIWRTSGNQTIMFSNSSRTTRTKHAFTLKSNDHVVSINGGAVSGASQNNSTSPASSGPVSFNAGGNTLNGYISRLTYYPTRLQDFQLQQLTK